MSHRVLVLGSGGREHAICWKLSESPSVDRVYALPGSDAIAAVNKTRNVTVIRVTNFLAIAKWCHLKDIRLVVVGPEHLLANGVADVLREFGIHCFGPVKAGARIESDKNWAKDFMKAFDIPTASYQSFTNIHSASTFITS